LAQPKRDSIGFQRILEISHHILPNKAVKWAYNIENDFNHHKTKNHKPVMLMVLKQLATMGPCCTGPSISQPNRSHFQLEIVSFLKFFRAGLKISREPRYIPPKIDLKAQGRKLQNYARDQAF